jgi:hypothetical protein
LNNRKPKEGKKRTFLFQRWKRGKRRTATTTKTIISSCGADVTSKLALFKY